MTQKYTLIGILLVIVALAISAFAPYNQYQYAALKQARVVSRQYEYAVVKQAPVAQQYQYAVITPPLVAQNLIPVTGENMPQITQQYQYAVVQPAPVAQQYQYR